MFIHRGSDYDHDIMALGNHVLIGKDKERLLQHFPEYFFGPGLHEGHPAVPDNIHGLLIDVEKSDFLS